MSAPDAGADPAVDVYRALVNVTRFEVIDGRISDGARALVAYGVEVTASLQDDGRTLKVFLVDREQPEPEASANPLAVRERELARLRIRARRGDDALGDTDGTS